MNYNIDMLNLMHEEDKHEKQFKNNNINMPIITMIDDIVNGKKSPDDFIKLLIKLK